jgi:3-oxoacyl-[acyl-carrier-protein] synthase II
MRKVVVTGVGMVSPLGCGSEIVWQRLLSGACGVHLMTDEITATTRRDCGVHVAATVPRGKAEAQFDPEVTFGRSVDKEMALFTQFAVAAADHALAHAQLDCSITSPTYDPNRIGVSLASGMGSIDDIVDSARIMEASVRKLSPYFVPKVLLNLAAGQVSIRHRLRGPLLAPATACAAGSHAIGEAFNMIRLGYCEAMLAGGTEACISKLAIAGFSRMKALSKSASPSEASRPFDTNRDGFVIAEGACVLVLEEMESAVKRKAPILAELVGYGLSADAVHVSSPPENGDGAIRAILSALNDASLKPADIDYINAHATSTPVGDAVEANAIAKVFGHGANGSKPLVSSTKVFF